MKTLITRLILTAFLFQFVLSNTFTQVNDAVTVNGQLSVIGNNLCNQYNNPIQLRGMSTHGLQWFSGCITDQSLDVLANEWDADILRISLYVQEGGYETDPVGYTNLVNSIVEKVTQRGMYALIDWHQLNPGDPNANLTNATQFFTDVATAHKDKNNIIYDICNEPNGVPWSSIKNYADQIIPVIRAIDPNAPILIGTHGWGSLGVSDGRTAQDIIDNPVNFPNIMYTFHFYAASHRDGYYNQLDWASDRLPIFVTEFGTQTYSGDGTNDFTYAQKYLDLLAQKKISWTNWNFSDDFRSGAVWNTGTCSSGAWTDANLKEAGIWIKDKILNPADNFPISGVIPPTVEIISPNNNSIFKSGESITISAHATDVDGTITQVEFFADGTLIEVDNTYPYSIVWSNGTIGTHTLTAKATNDQNVSATSSPVNIEIESLIPIVVITSPMDGESFVVGTPINIAATASAPNTTISDVKFYANSVLISVDQTAPYTAVFNDAPIGTHTIVATATDNSGVTASDAVTITVTTDPGSCDVPQYVAGSPVATGESVSNYNIKYECKVGGWCSSDASWAYEPGVGAHWEMAWTEVGPCIPTDPVLTSIVVSPANATIAEGETQQFTAQGYDQNGNVMNTTINWSASTGSISSSGLYTGTVVVSNATVTASSGNISGTASITVNEVVVPVLTTIVVSPANTTIAEGETQQFNAQGYDQNGNAMNTTVNWSASAGAITSSGLYTGTVVVTNATVTASSGNVSGTASITVNEVVVPVLTTIVVSPANATIAKGATQQFTARGYDQNGNTMSTTVNWSASAGAITSSGLYTGTVTVTNATVTATSGTVSGTAAISVNLVSNCIYPPWTCETTYTNQIVEHNGHAWKAKWWTQCEEPGTTGQWGVWEDLGLCSAFKNSGNSIPESMGHELNVFPNPFSATINFDFNLAEDSYVEIRVYNNAGSVIRTLLNYNLNKGQHQIEFDGSELPTGLYFYKIQFNNEILSGSLIKE